MQPVCNAAILSEDVPRPQRTRARRDGLEAARRVQRFRRATGGRGGLLPLLRCIGARFPRGRPTWPELTTERISRPPRFRHARAPCYRVSPLLARRGRRRLTLARLPPRRRARGVRPPRGCRTVSSRRSATTSPAASANPRATSSPSSRTIGAEGVLNHAPNTRPAGEGERVLSERDSGHGPRKPQVDPVQELHAPGEVEGPRSVDEVAGDQAVAVARVVPRLLASEDVRGAFRRRTSDPREEEDVEVPSHQEAVRRAEDR